jgi:hypothetical protein
MTETTTLERLLLDDLDVEGERAADEKFCTELYRALTNNVWRNDRDPEGELSPSWQRAEWLVNEWRARHGHDPLTLAQTGGEGEVSPAVEEELGRLGWQHRPLNTSTNEDAHVGNPEQPPPGDTGRRLAPDDSHPRFTKSARHSGDVSGDRSGNNVA